MLSFISQHVCRYYGEIGKQESVPIAMRVLCFVLLCGYASGYCCNDNPYIRDAGPLVRTASGAVVGKYVKVFDTDVAAFLGIPYAEPPTKDKRFQKPTPIQYWEDIREVTKKPSPCMQHSSRNFSWIPNSATPDEDCLYLNVWIPAKCCCADQERLSVLVWIYGGGFYAGSTDMDVYDGSTLALYSKSIVVTINYRVGIFGFLNSGSDEAPGNAGLHDQNLALKWVKTNIGYFGGDETRVTLMGESAGAWSVSLHMVSPMSRNTFNRAILQSATSYHPLLVDSAAVAYVKANTYAKTVGCLNGNSSIESDSEVLECLKGKDPWDLAKAEDFFTSRLPFYFMPSYGNEFLPVSPIRAINEGDISPVDVLIGNTEDEVSIFLNYIIPDVFKQDSEPRLNLDAAQTIIGALFQTASQPSASEIFQQYFRNITGSDSKEIVRAILHAFGDSAFYCPVQFFAEKSGSAFMYWITHRSMKDRLSDWMGVPHFSEVPYVFGVPIHDTDSYTPEDGRFSGDLIHKWTLFSEKGHPLADKNPEKWPRFTADQPSSYELNPRKGGVLTYPRAAACEFWRPYFCAESC